jgi:polyhydroxyalkanoate synthesis repressor PhaR
MSEPRVIKKYPNRRLYDTVESRYITLTDVKRLVVEKVGFIVVDKKNNADITGSILLQVISEQEHQGDPLLNREFMTQLIRAYGASQHTQVAAHLDQSLRMYFVQHPPRESPRQRAAPEESGKNVPH